MVEIKIDPDVFLDKYRPLLDDDNVDVEILYGSRDTGKSQFVAQVAAMTSLRLDYMRCLLIRKTLNTIKESQVKTIQDVVDGWKLSQFFNFKQSLPSEIEVESGSQFYARGLDNPDKIKSFRNPTHAWVEELAELDEDDWILLITSMRSNKGRTKIWGTLNPKAPTGTDYREFWLWKYIFKGQTEKSFTLVKTVKTPRGDFDITIRVTHATYLDNPYCDPLRMAVYEDLKNVSPYHYRINALGEWANHENKSPFILTFNREKHLAPTKPDFGREFYFSFDFNRNPMCCNVIQSDLIREVKWIEVVKLPNSSIDDMCDYLLASYPNALYIVCGDGSGSSQSGLIREFDLNSYYKRIKARLGLLDSQLQYQVNPPIAENRVLVNHCFRHLDITINPDTCQPLIFDLEFAEVKADGSLLKGDRTDPKQQLDALDGCRYFLNRYFAHLNPLQ